MKRVAPGETWDEASTPEAVRLARAYESAWRRGGPQRPELADYLPKGNDAPAGALLALLRADMALRWEGQEPLPVDWYRERFPELPSDALVALLYEEFCLREEAGESPSPAEYEARFPDVFPALREVLEIHELVSASPGSTLPHATSAGIVFPEVGQTIGGFHLVEELGRGSFARVFLAEERELASRRVALKLAHIGTREPQTLARLQHTNIVPVYSYQVDPVTGLHVLCMPYFGRVTLARVIAEQFRGRGLPREPIAAVLDRLQPDAGEAGERPPLRQTLARLTHARAIAWWGARLAEALQHAHDRGVLHRDIKPSNVLITSEGMPMLLDFNLARGPVLDDPAGLPGPLGGTLAYMAPEHLEALQDGCAERIDHRCDVYSLGMVLYEALGAQPLAARSSASTSADSLQWVLDQRKEAPAALREQNLDVPAALDAVVRKCLAPDPVDRYATAGELAADLQAVADDGPLHHAREPLASRSFRWTRRNRRRISVAVPMVLGMLALGGFLLRAHQAGLRLEADARNLFQQGEAWLRAGEFRRAEDAYTRVVQMTSGHAGLRELQAAARSQYRLARETDTIRSDVDRFLTEVEPLQFELLQTETDTDRRAASTKLQAALGRFHVFDSEDWTARPELARLDSTRHTRLRDEVNELLFLWIAAVARDQPKDSEMARSAVVLCDRALRFAEPRGPWEALRKRYAAVVAGSMSRPPVPPDPATVSSARACFQWGLLAQLVRPPGAARAWFDRAAWLEPGRFRYQFAAGYVDSLAGDIDAGLAHYDAALALEPRSAWVRFNRAQLYGAQKGAWTAALEDLEQAAARPEHLDVARIRLELGIVEQHLGDRRAARAAYMAGAAASPASLAAHRARFNLAKLDAESGSIAAALATYTELLRDPNFAGEARLGRALLYLRLGRAAEAEQDLTESLRTPLGRAAQAELLGLRAQARLALDRPVEAEPDALEALRLQATPARVRLWGLTVLAAGRLRDVPFTDPEEFDRLPARRPLVTGWIKGAMGRQASELLDSSMLDDLASHLQRAVLWSALNEHASARTEADRAVALAPFAGQPYLTRARVRRRAGDRSGALGDVEQGLSLDADSVGLRLLSGQLKLEMGQPKLALPEIDRALLAGAPGSAYALRAQALQALGRFDEAVAAWTRAIAFDAEDPRAFLGRARCWERLGRWDSALPDLETAAEWAADEPALLCRLAVAYATILPARPSRWGRVLDLARQAVRISPH